MTLPTKPKVVHVYRSDGPNPLWIDQHCTAPYPDPTHRLCRGEYLGEYVPAPGPVVADVPEESTLSHAIVAAVRAYQTSFASVTGADTSEVDNGNLREFRREMLEAIEADAKEREG